MNRKIMLFLLAVMIIPMAVLNASPIEVKSGLATQYTAVRPDIDLSLRLIGGEGSVLRPGRDIRITFETSRDAYVIIYNIDTDGLVQLLYPLDGKPRLAQGGKTYYLPAGENGIYWQVRGNTGIEYIHAVAVTNSDRLDMEELRFLAENPDLPSEEQLRIDSDPYLAFNMIDEALVRGAGEEPPASDFTYFYINEKVDYPRYLCNQCHGEGSIEDPYAAECPEIVLEKMTSDEGLFYPYPALFTIRHVGGEDDGSYYSSSYADNLDGPWSDYDDYDDDKLYLSIYYTDFDYPYYYNWPYYRSWYASYYSPMYWDWDPWFWDVTFSWNWGNYYYHHRPFDSWYYHYYAYYDWGCNYGYWNDWRWSGGCYHDWHCYGHNDHHQDFRSMYANRRFTKRSINNAVASASYNRTRNIERTKQVKGWATESRNRTLDRSRFVKRDDDDRGIRNNAGNRTSLIDGRDRGVRRQVIYGNDSGTRSGSGNVRRTVKPATPAVPTSDKGSRSMLKDRSGSTSRERATLRDKVLERNRKESRNAGDAAAEAKKMIRDREEKASDSSRTPRRFREWVKDPGKSGDSSARKESEKRENSSDRESPFKRRESSSGNHSVKRSDSSNVNPFNRSSSGSSSNRNSSSSQGGSRPKRK